MSKVLVSSLLFLTVLSFPSWVLAAYILPYPSYMPGNKLYRVMRIFDETKRYWYWGNLSSYRYLLGQSDKALVESKTLFEYGQLSFALAALERSNYYLNQAPYRLVGAREEGKDVRRYERELHEAKAEHVKVIARLLETTPKEYFWRPEKENPTNLAIHAELTKALELRQ